jgi:hypothetical protein
MLKEAHYSVQTRKGNHSKKVKYVLLGKSCVFSSVAGPGPVSDEGAVQAIVDAEHLDPTQTVFFDLRINTQTPDFPGSAYDFLELNLESCSDGLHVTNRTDTACFPEVLQEFGVFRTGID